MRRTLLLTVLSLLAGMMWTQTYTYRYWTDNDIGGAVSGSATGETQFTVDFSGRGNGIHTIHVQAKNAAGAWSSVRTRYILLNDGQQQAASTARYWIDDKTSAIHTGVATEGIIELDLSRLDNGIHAVHYQMIAANGVPSAVRTRYFLLNDGQQQTASTARYWLDNDLTTMHDNVSTSGVIELDLSKLDVGLHSVHYQTIAANGIPSSVRTRYFLIGETSGSYTCRLWIDDNEAGAQSYDLSDQPFEIDLGDLEGEHLLHVVIYDLLGKVVDEQTHTFDAGQRTPIPSSYTFRYNAEKMTVGSPYSWTLNGAVLVYELSHNLNITQAEFEENYGVDGFSDIFTQYYMEDGAIKPCGSAEAYANGSLGTIQLRSNIEDEELFVVNWTITVNDLQNYVDQLGNSQPNLARYICFKKSSGSTLAAPSTLWICIMPAGLEIVTPPNVSGTVAWNNEYNKKNLNKWYAENTGAAGYDEIHVNTISPDDYENPGWMSRASALGIRLANVFTKSSNSAGQDNKMVTPTDDGYDAFVRLSDGATISGKDLKLDLVLTIDPAEYIFKADVGNGQTVEYCTQVKPTDSKVLQAWQDINANGRYDSSYESMFEIAKLIYDETDCTANPQDSINHYYVSYMNNAFADALLNYKSANQLADDVIKAVVAVKATYKGYDIPLTNNTFDVRFLRPINVFNVDCVIEDSSTDGESHIINLRDLVRFTDWRDNMFTTDYWQYYNIRAIKPLGVPNGGKVSNNMRAQTNKGGSTVALANQNDVDFIYRDASPATPKSSGEFGTADSFGTLEYSNQDNTAQEFDVWIPLVVTYEWGDAYTTARIHVRKTEPEPETPLTVFTALTSEGVKMTFKVIDEEGKLCQVGDDSYSAAISEMTMGTVTIPSTVKGYKVTTIGAYAFYNCRLMDNVVIPEGITTIQCFAFKNCSALTDINYPNSLVYLLDSSFDGCAGLTTVTIPKNVYAGHNYCYAMAPFPYCTNLTEIKVDPANPYLESIDGVLYLKDHSDISQYPAGKKDSHYKIMDGIGMLFAGAFAGNRYLQSVTIPASVTYINGGIFDGCTNLTKVTVYNPSPVNIVESTFSNRANATLYVPVGSKADYETASYWSGFKEIVEMSNNALYAIDHQASPGSTVELTVSLDNDEEVRLCQFDLQLPAGVTVAKKSNGKLDAKLTERGEYHSISSKQLSNGNYRFIISSLDNDSFTGNSGPLLKITLDVSATMESGIYTVKVLNTELSVPEGNDLKVVNPEDSESKLTVKAYMPGDVNNDGSVSVTDVGCAINYILEQVPSVFIFDAADMNGDKNISVTDVGMIINLILSEGAASRQEEQPAIGEAQLSLMPTTDGYQMQLENKAAFIGFQFDIQLTNGVTVNGIKLVGSNDHLLTYRWLNNGMCRVVCYSPTNSTFAGDETALLDISTTGDMTISNICLTTAGLAELHPALGSMMTGIASMNQGLLVSSQDGVLQIITDKDTTVRLYTLGGSVCRILNVHRGVNTFEGLRAGIYMIGNRKVILR